MGKVIEANCTIWWEHIDVLLVSGYMGFKQFQYYVKICLSKYNVLSYLTNILISVMFRMVNAIVGASCYY